VDANRSASRSWWTRRSSAPPDRVCPGWEAVAQGIDSDQGWPLYLDRYAALIKDGD
jgi:hypothetical protein